MELLNKFNLFIFLLLTALYFYQIIYVFVAFYGEKKKRRFLDDAETMHRYGVVIAARNESLVITNLIESIKKQNYPSSLIDIFVIADNCTDNTAEIARSAGAIVYERFNTSLVGKGFALDYLFNCINKDYGSAYYDGYFIFDADNLLDKNYIREMNKVFDSGYNVITSYRNSKNFGTNWITAGYSLWFLRESKFLNNSRMILNTSCAISGTGFLINSSIVRKNRGWKYHLLTEDIEFSVANAIEGEKIGYCEKASLYDEQPETFIQSWNQRLRWSKGFYQVMGKYGTSLLKHIFTKNGFSLSCYDMFMTIAPATFISMFCVLVNSFLIIDGLFDFYTWYFLLPIAKKAILFSFLNCYTILFIMGLLTTITEWNNIKCKNHKKILYTFTFPIFIFTYVPISIVALFKQVEWKPITHSISKSVEEMR